MQGMPVTLPETFSQNPQGAEIGLWPLAWGWWLVIIASIAVLFLTGAWLISRYRKRKALREAIKTLKTLQATSDSTLAQCNQILKRAFMSYFPPALVASLHGTSWKSFLETQIKAKQQQRFENLFQGVSDNLYQPKMPRDGSQEMDAVALSIDYLKQALPPGKRQLADAEVLRD